MDLKINFKINVIYDMVLIFKWNYCCRFVMVKLK